MTRVRQPVPRCRLRLRVGRESSLFEVAGISCVAICFTGAEKGSEGVLRGFGRRSDCQILFLAVTGIVVFLGID